MAVATASSTSLYGFRRRFTDGEAPRRSQSAVLSVRASLRNTVEDLTADGVGVSKLPLRKIPGDCGPPVIGPWRDRQDYFYDQGREEFFKSRMKKYESTVFRANMPPGPCISFNSNVVALLDGKSYPVLFDMDKVEKKDVFTGTYSISTDLTGGYRVLSNLDPSEPEHAKIKKLMFFLATYRRDHVIPEFKHCYGELLQNMESELVAKGKALFGPASDQAAFNFVARAFLGVDPRDSKLESDGPKLVNKWILFNLHPLMVLGLPRGIEDVLLHTFPLPSFLVKKDYQKLYDFFYQNSGAILQEAEKLEISPEEACHNLVFATCFNSYGGFKLFFSNMLKWVARGGPKLHRDLALEVREAVRSSGGAVTIRAIEKMPLAKSVVSEALRIEPPVPHQYGRAKRDFVIESHDGAFQIKEGEMLYGYQPFATKDPKIFDRPEEFIPDRFVGEEGEKLLKHVVWSNGPETSNPTLNNKQCAGKDFVALASRLLLVEIFLRYDSFGIEVEASPLGASITFTSLKRASF